MIAAMGTVTGSRYDKLDAPAAERHCVCVLMYTMGQLFAALFLIRQQLL